MAKRKRVLAIIAIVGAVLLIGLGVLAYRVISSQMNFGGMLARGEATQISVPEGFEVNVFAEGLVGPRFMQFGPQGRLFVAERGADQIAILEDTDGDGRSDIRTVFADDIPDPHSIVFHEGDWYVGVPRGVIRLTDSDGDGRADVRDVLIDDYPTSNHSTRTVEFLPDGRMVVSVGSSCNVCEEEDPRRASILVYEEVDVSEHQIYARGLRNAVGLARHPLTGELWVTNNGRDMMGDDLPPETIYRIEESTDYGWPRCHSGRIPDPEFGFAAACEGVEPPIIEMQAHSAPLGLIFYSGEMFPEPYRDDLFIAFHGSWNRSTLTGYKIVRLPFDGHEPGAEVVDFATGWLGDDLETVTGRPVGLSVGPDGALYVSDDSGGFIYRITYSGEQDKSQTRQDVDKGRGQEQSTAEFAPARTPGISDLSTSQPPSATVSEEVQVTNLADVLAVRATGNPNEYQFAVEVASPDTGCDQYTDWWEVVTEQGELLYRRTLLHSHVNEQPFTRSGGPVPLDPDTVAIVRAHMHPGGYGGVAMRGSVAEGFTLWEEGGQFALDLADVPPQPPDCGF